MTARNPNPATTPLLILVGPGFIRIRIIYLFIEGIGGGIGINTQNKTKTRTKSRSMRRSGDPEIPIDLAWQNYLAWHLGPGQYSLGQ